jgi:hypothetical protein
MAWVRLDDKRATNSKLRSAGFAARGLDEAAICWSSHEEDDGFISDDDVEMLASLHHCQDWEGLVQTLVDVGRWKTDRRRRGYVIQGFLEFNPSRADLEARREKDRDRKRSRLRGDTDSARNLHGNQKEASGNP